MSKTNELRANGYQRSKARKMAAVILQGAAQTNIPYGWLPGLTGRMTDGQWRAIAFQAGIPVADHAARVLCVAILLEASK